MVAVELLLLLLTYHVFSPLLSQSLRLGWLAQSPFLHLERPFLLGDLAVLARRLDLPPGLLTRFEEVLLRHGVGE